MRIRNNLIDLLVWLFCLCGCLVSSMIFSPHKAFAFTKLKNGFEMVTNTYLIPLSYAVAGAAFVVFIILSYFKPEENQKKIGTVLFLAIINAAGLELLTKLSQSFS